MSDKLADWTKGAEAIVYQTCGACGKVQYFDRSFCAACGAPDPAQKRASGAATVYATSLVCRAATPETRAHVPYNIVLVDADEGFRMMATATTILRSVTRSPQVIGRLREGWCRTSRKHESPTQNAHATKQPRITRNRLKSECFDASTFSASRTRRWR